MPSHNRKERRAAAAAAKEASSFDPSSIPLAHAPEYTDETPPKPKGKTLYELAAEREAELFPSSSKSISSSTSRSRQTEFVNILPSGELSHTRPSSSDTKSSANSVSTSRPSSPETGDPRITKLNAREQDTEEEDESIPPFADTLLTSLPLSALHFTLAFLAAHQFAQEIELGRLIWESSVIAFPSLTFMVHFAHGHVISFKKFERLLWRTRSASLPSKITLSSLLSSIFPPTPGTLFFLPLACYLGFRLIVITNDSGYYAVMKRAPPIGTLWVWCVLEMSPGASLLAFLLPLVYGIMWEGYNLF
ncbi:hypothetical protein FQN54_006951 [Arachnomyces sp. PD_36]|nr:hypothetical protein FQN54_006951 [Arachnomyces sp. PD_36]